MSDSGSDAPVSGDEANDQWDDWASDEGEVEATKSLFDSVSLPSPEAALDYDSEKHSFDLRQYSLQLNLDDYGLIRVINFIRCRVAAGADPRPELALAAAASPGSPAPWDDERYLVPVLPDDPLITCDFSELDAVTGGGIQGTATTGSAPNKGGAQELADARQRLAALEAENEALRLRLDGLMEAFLPEGLAEAARADAAAEQRKALGARSGAGGTDAAAAASTLGLANNQLQDAGPSGSSSSSSTVAAAAAAGASQPAGPSSSGRLAPSSFGAHTGRTVIDTAYFESYSTFDIHREMIADKARTDAYRDALTLNPALLKGAAVLDVGCGSGILSLFAARAGAARVVGVDGSARVAAAAAAVAAANGLGEETGGPVRILSGRVEALTNIGVDKVDVLVSEWMGYALLFESMLDSVLAARDAWLRPGGAMLPDRAALYVAGASAAALGLDFWKDVYGFSMDPVAQDVAAACAGHAHVREVPASCLLTSAARVQSFDLATMSAADQDFSTEFELQALASAPGDAGGSGDAELAVVVLWFDVEFSARFCKEAPVTLSTSPHSPVTHWAQVVLPLRRPLPLPAAAASGSSAVFQGRLSMARSRSTHRCLDMSVEYKVADGQGGWLPVEVTTFTMKVTGGD